MYIFLMTTSSGMSLRLLKRLNVANYKDVIENERQAFLKNDLVSYGLIKSSAIVTLIQNCDL